MKKYNLISVCLIALVVISLGISGFGQEDFSADLLIDELRRAEELINSGRVNQGLDSLKGVRSILESKINQLAGAGTEGDISSAGLSELRERMSSFETRLNELEGTAASGKGSMMRVGYVNASEAFQVFTDLVQVEREAARSKNEELLALREQAIKGEISESEYRKQSDILQAEKLKAQLEIDLAMVEKMISAKGFESVSSQLNQLKDQVAPIMTELEQTLQNLRSNAATPEEVAQTLSQINNQYQQLDDLLTRLIETKIFQIANREASREGYDLVLRQENVVLHANQNSVDNLTEMTKEALKADLSNN